MRRAPGVVLKDARAADLIENALQDTSTFSEDALRASLMEAHERYISMGANTVPKV